MNKSSFKANLWFQERTPDLYFWIVSFISLIVFVSAMKMFVNMQFKKNNLEYKFLPWQKWTIFASSLLLLGMFVSDLIYRYIAYYQVMPYHTSYAWKYIVFTTFLLIEMLALWIFKGIINGQWKEWKQEAKSWISKKSDIQNSLDKEKTKGATATNIKKVSQDSTESVFSPVTGTIKDITKVKDEVFSKKLMGDGVAISPRDNVIVSPVDGVIESAFHTGHAFGIKTDKNLSLLVHIGIDTVKLNGKGFATKIKQGDRVKKGQVLSNVDFATIKKAKYDTDVILIVLPESQKMITNKKTTGNINKNRLIFKVK